MLQVLAVRWGTLQTVFDSVDLTLMDWGRATTVAGSVLLLDEARKLLYGLYRGKPLINTR